eukprot:4512342-Pyramimonas_sp.AAC.1
MRAAISCCGEARPEISETCWGRAFRGGRRDEFSNECPDTMEGRFGTAVCKLARKNWSSGR